MRITTLVRTRPRAVRGIAAAAALLVLAGFPATVTRAAAATTTRTTAGRIKLGFFPNVTPSRITRRAAEDACRSMGLEGPLAVRGPRAGGDRDLDLAARHLHVEAVGRVGRLGQHEQLCRSRGPQARVDNHRQRRSTGPSCRQRDWSSFHGPASALGSLGSPRTISPRMLRWTWLVPA